CRQYRTLLRHRLGAATCLICPCGHSCRLHSHRDARHCPFLSGRRTHHAAPRARLSHRLCGTADRARSGRLERFVCRRRKIARTTRRSCRCLFLRRQQCSCTPRTGNAASREILRRHACRRPRRTCRCERTHPAFLACRCKHDSASWPCRARPVLDRPCRDHLLPADRHGGRDICFAHQLSRACLCGDSGLSDLWRGIEASRTGRPRPHPRRYCGKRGLAQPDQKRNAAATLTTISTAAPTAMKRMVRRSLTKRRIASPPSPQSTVATTMATRLASTRSVACTS